MYHTRDSIDQLDTLKENKENIVKLLVELADLGWKQSHWVKYMGSDEKPFIEIYGDDSYKHIKGETIEDCYEKALASVKRLKTCEHQWKYREDAFTICEKCGQFGRATLEEMKQRFDKFHLKDENENERYYSDEPLCEKCGCKEMIHFGNSRKDGLGAMCPNCRTVVEKRVKKAGEKNWGLQAYPTDKEYKLRIPYRESDVTLSIHKMMTFGRESEQSLLRKIQRANENLLESVKKTECVIDPNYVLTQQEQTEYLKKYALRRKFNLVKDDNQYQVLDINFNFDGQQLESLEIKLAEAEEQKPSDSEVLGNVLKEMANQIDKEETE